MPAIEFSTASWAKLEWTAVIVILLVSGTEIFVTIAPYFGLHPTGETSALSQQQTIMQNVFISCVSFLIGASVGTRKKDDTIVTQANTIAAAQGALPPVPGATQTVPLAAGETVAVKADPPTGET
jgi:hypothetical protein